MIADIVLANDWSNSLVLEQRQGSGLAAAQLHESELLADFCSVSLGKPGLSSKARQKVLVHNMGKTGFTYYSQQAYGASWHL